MGTWPHLPSTLILNWITWEVWRSKLELEPIQSGSDPFFSAAAGRPFLPLISLWEVLLGYISKGCLKCLLLFPHVRTELVAVIESLQCVIWWRIVFHILHKKHRPFKFAKSLRIGQKSSTVCDVTLFWSFIQWSADVFLMISLGRASSLFVCESSGVNTEPIRWLCPQSVEQNMAT